MNKQHIGIFIAGALLGALAIPAAGADAPTAPASVSKPLADPVAPVKELAGIFRRARSLTYTDTLTFKQYGGTLGAVNRSLTIQAELTKPGQYKYDMGSAGVLISSGSSAGGADHGWNLAVDGAKTKYCRYAATGDLSVGQQWPFVSSKVLSSSASVLNYSLAGYLFGHISDADFVAPQSMTVIGMSTVLDGKAVLDVEYKSAFTDVHLYMDPATNMLTGAHSINTDQYGRVTDVTEQFTGMAIAKQIADSEYSTTPPLGATAIQLPLPPVVKPPVVRPPTSRPKRSR